MADWVFWSRFPQMGPPRRHTPFIYKTEGMCAVRGQNTARIQMRNVDAWSLAEAIVLICGPMTKRPRYAKPWTVGILDR